MSDHKKVWFCIDKRLSKASRPAAYSIIYFSLPGETTGQKELGNIKYIELKSECARAKSLKVLIEQYEAGLDLNISYRPRTKTLTNQIDEAFGILANLDT